MSELNPNCDGGRCRERNAETRWYKLGGGARLGLCLACWAHENRYRFNRGKETGRPADWPQLDWNCAEVAWNDVKAEAHGVRS
jgi:hypothetical protein